YPIVAKNAPGGMKPVRDRVATTGRCRRPRGSVLPEVVREVVDRVERLIGDRLVDELLHELAEIRALRARRLRHQHCGHLLLRVHPEVSAGVARPHELAGRAGHARNSVAGAHREAEAEAVALGAEQQLARLNWLLD